MNNVFDPENKLESDCCKNGVFEEKDGTIHCGACTKECTYSKKRGLLDMPSLMFIFKAWIYAYIVYLVILSGIEFTHGSMEVASVRIFLAIWVGLYMMQMSMQERQRELIKDMFKGWDESHRYAVELLEISHKLEDENNALKKAASPATTIPVKHL